VIANTATGRCRRAATAVPLTTSSTYPIPDTGVDTGSTGTGIIALSTWITVTNSASGTSGNHTNRADSCRDTARKSMP
jgi:hypothetical protein